MLSTEYCHRQINGSTTDDSSSQDEQHSYAYLNVVDYLDAIYGILSSKSFTGSGTGGATVTLSDDDINGIVSSLYKCISGTIDTLSAHTTSSDIHFISGDISSYIDTLGHITSSDVSGIIDKDYLTGTLTDVYMPIGEYMSTTELTTISSEISSTIVNSLNYQEKGDYLSSSVSATISSTVFEAVTDAIDGIYSTITSSEVSSIVSSVVDKNYLTDKLDGVYMPSGDYLSSSVSATISSAVFNTVTGALTGVSTITPYDMPISTNCSFFTSSDFCISSFIDTPIIVSSFSSGTVNFPSTLISANLGHNNLLTREIWVGVTSGSSVTLNNRLSCSYDIINEDEMPLHLSGSNERNMTYYIFVLRCNTSGNIGAELAYSHSFKTNGDF